MASKKKLIIVLVLIFGLNASALHASQRPLRTVWVKIVADQKYSRQTSWEKKAARELDEIAEPLAEVLGIRLEIIGYDWWYNRGGKDFNEVATRMINEVEPGNADVIIGFTIEPSSLHRSGDLRTDGMTVAYCGMMIKTYSGGVDANFYLPFVLIHEMVHLFGGVHINDGSLMSPRFEKKMNLALDPLNTRIVKITRDIDFKEGYQSLSETKLIGLSQLYEKAIDKGNLEIPTFLELASMYTLLEEHEKAIELYRRIVEREPADTHSWLMMGDCYHRMEKPRLTIEVFEEALGHAERKDLLYGKLAVLYFNEGLYQNSYNNAGLARDNGAYIDPALWKELKRQGISGDEQN